MKHIYQAIKLLNANKPILIVLLLFAFNCTANAQKRDDWPTGRDVLILNDDRHTLDYVGFRIPNGNDEWAMTHRKNHSLLFEWKGIDLYKMN
ncbi:MAG: hypothetical protein AAFY41_06395, partial [Bacteroidota bacterium]